MNYSSKNLLELFKNKEINLSSKMYSEDFLSIGAFDIIFPSFLEHLKNSPLASDYRRLPGGPQITIGITENNHGFVMDGKIVTITPAYRDLGDDDETFINFYDGFRVEPEDSESKVNEEFQKFASSHVSVELAQKADERLAERKVKSDLYPSYH